MNKLIKLHQFLLKRNFTKEANILKSAYPIMEDGLMELHEDESVSVKKKYFDDLYNRKIDDVAGETPDKWYEAVSFVKDDMIVISFKKNLNSNFYKKLLSVIENKNLELSKKTDYGYVDVASKAINGKVKNEQFLKHFPEAKNQIIQTIKNKYSNLTDQEIIDFANENLIIILIGEEQFGNFKKSPYYMGHDLGHVAIDEEGDTNFTIELESVILSVAELYIPEEEESNEENYNFQNLAEALEFESNYMTDNSYQILISEFFPYQNDNPEDRYPDVFANFLKGNLNYDVPEYIDFKDKSYIIKEENKEKALNILKQYVYQKANEFGNIKNLDEYIEDNIQEMNLPENQKSPLENLNGYTIVL